MKSFLKYVLASVLGVMLAGLILFFIILGVMSAIISSQDKPFQVKPKSVLMLKLDQPIIDRKPNLPLPSFGLGNIGMINQIGLNDLLNNINKASKDTNICGIYLQLSTLQTGIATLQEIRFKFGLLGFEHVDPNRIIPQDLTMQVFMLPP